MLRFAACLLLCMASPASAEDLSGSWDLRAGDVIVFRMQILKSSKGWIGTWTRPTHFLTDGDGFSDLSGPVIQRKTSNVREVDGDLELTFGEPVQPNGADVLRLHRLAGTSATMTFVNTGLASFPMTRAAARTVPGHWDIGQHYPVQIARPTNARMTEIFDADQAARETTYIDWKIVTPADAERRKEAQALLDANALHSGADFFHAAFVFQHGHTPDDFLKAHLLALVAVARGRSDAVWIASATLDRYLQNIHQPQVLGTQFAIRAGKADQEPFNRALISDALRSALKVPTLAAQAEQGKGFEARDAKAKAAAPANP